MYIYICTYAHIDRQLNELSLVLWRAHRADGWAQGASCIYSVCTYIIWIYMSM